MLMQNVSSLLCLRCSGIVAASLWSGGHVVAGLGVMSHSLPMLIFGYGVMGGMGLGLGYITPVGTLIRWFPGKYLLWFVVCT